MILWIIFRFSASFLGARILAFVLQYSILCLYVMHFPLSYVSYSARCGKLDIFSLFAIYQIVSVCAVLQLLGGYLQIVKVWVGIFADSV